MMAKAQRMLLALAFVAFWGQLQAAMSTEEKLIQLRQKMQERGYSAYIIPSDDEHQSEYTAEYDRRRAWISGLTGSSGTAVVTLTQAAVWTDSRYYLQAEMQLDSRFWMLMKASESTTPTIEAWLAQVLEAGDKVGLMAKFTPIDAWQTRDRVLSANEIILEDAQTDLIDEIWTPAEGRPPKPSSSIFIHDIRFAGKSWEEKINEIRVRMTQQSADLLVVTALDEIAWLFNMRASDVPNNPFFFSYAIVNRNGAHTLFIEPNRLSADVRAYLDGVLIKDYASVISDITAASNSGKTIWISPMSSFSIYNAVSNKDKMVMRSSPIRSIKARKNEVELRNLRNCHIRDSVARIRHMFWLEDEMQKGGKITEQDAAQKLLNIQSQDPHFVGPSFGTISAVGKNAAVIHYSTAEGDNSQLTRDKVFLLDAGAQYQDCSTDVTRTHHYGQPTKEEIYAYTKVLQGSTNLASIVFPTGVQGRDLDVEARKPLWKDGLDYGHGTGHGIGYFLSIHEAPPNTNYASRSEYNEGFDAGMIQSDEPGYYEDGKFGIRLETDIESVATPTQYDYRGRQYLKFEALTYVPFERNLIDECALTNEQVDWLNKYNEDIRNKVGLRLFDYPEIRAFMIKKTHPFIYAHLNAKCPVVSSGYFADNSAKAASYSAASLGLFMVLSVVINFFAN